MKAVFVHWLFKVEPELESHHLCDIPKAALNIGPTIVLRPVIRQKSDGRLRECSSCAAIGKELHIP